MAAAIRIAQLMELDRLGSHQEIMPKWDDLAFPTGPSSVKRQVCCRIFWNLMFLDAAWSTNKARPSCEHTPNLLSDYGAVPRHLLSWQL